MDWIFMIMSSGGLVDIDIKVIFSDIKKTQFGFSSKKVSETNHELVLTSGWMSSYIRLPLQTKQ